jgi:hypothetical protein
MPGSKPGIDDEGVFRNRFRVRDCLKYTNHHLKSDACVRRFLGILWR